MHWFGKAIGAVLGLAVAGPFGSVLGALLGHQFDQGLGTQFGGAERTQKLFFEVSFEVMGHLAKVDGRVTEEEIRIARRIMHAMRLEPEQVRAAIDCFTRGKDQRYAIQERIQSLYDRIGQRRDLARAFVEIQMQAAVGGGKIDDAKRQLLWDVAKQFGFTRVELAQIESLIRAQQTAGGSQKPSLSLVDAYQALGLSAGASDDEIKKAYRRLMNQHHPDKLVSKGLPESMMTIAEQKTREIRAAYDRIKDARNIK